MLRPDTVGNPIAAVRYHQDRMDFTAQRAEVSVPPVPTLEPSVRFAVETNPDGRAWSPTIEFDREGTLLATRQPVTDLSWLEWARWHAPDICPIVSVVAAVGLAAIVRRVLIRPQHKGRRYCRRCNYDLTPPVGESAAAGIARCPECGLEAAGRHGRGVGASLRWSVPLLAALILGSVWVFSHSVVAWVPSGWSRPWPGEWWGKLAPGWRMQRAQELDVDSQRVICRELPSGRVVLRETVPTRGMNVGQLSPDGSVYATIEYGMFGGPVVMRISPLNGGRSRVARLTDRQVGGVQFVGYSDDGKRAYAALQLFATGTDGHPDARARTYESVLLRVDVATAAVETVVSIETNMDRPNGGASMRTERFAAREQSDGTVRWVLFSDTGRGGAAQTAMVQVELVTGLDDRIGGTHSLSVPGTSWYDPMLSVSAGELTIPMYPVGQQAVVDLDTGRSRLEAATPNVANEGGVLSITTVSAPPGRSAMVITQRGRGTPLVKLGSGEAITYGGIIAPNGSWAAAIVLTPKFVNADGSLPTGDDDYRQEILIWDLRTLSCTHGQP